ncbi:5-oxoprolinase subunit PxpA [Psychroflexus tropicus]|uniref:5-oxoprolinase subunit PxpA n=1 Tax=Psychroflexus tropicus TaxID=197345 RepID=UPI00037FCF65|nr:5-oxoprolinase subunit PxpA [Psychroflexus tropicus]
MKHIDINCDLGEGGEFDKDLMPLISSCNIACGGHYGDKASVHKAVSLAKKHNVHIGAHPSYPDPTNFGRTSVSLPREDLKTSLHQQIDLVEMACQEFEVDLHHIKPHGALYNDMRKDKAIADLVLEVITERNQDIILFVPPKLEFSSEIPISIRLWTEGFADRGYNSDLSLVSRGEKDSVLSDPIQISNRVLKMVEDLKVSTISGESIPQKFDTICVHSDTQNSVQILMSLKNHLDQHGIKIK